MSMALGVHAQQKGCRFDSPTWGPLCRVYSWYYCSLSQFSCHVHVFGLSVGVNTDVLWCLNSPVINWHLVQSVTPLPSQDSWGRHQQSSDPDCRRSSDRKWRDWVAPAWLGLWPQCFHIMSLFLYLVSSSPMAKSKKKYACVRKRGGWIAQTTQEKTGKFYLLIGGRGKKSTFTQSTLSLSEVAPKEVANARSFPNVTDAHPTPRLPLDALLQGLPSLARLSYAAGNSFFQHCFKSTQHWPPALLPLFANHLKKYLKYTYFLWEWETVHFP